MGPQSEQQPGRRVLLVEDTMLVADEIEHMLQELGCEVVGPYARLGPACDAAHSDALDLALLDINLDDEAVYPVAEELLGRGIPFIFLTGYDAKSLPGEFRDFPCLTKPFGESELRAVIQDVLGASGGN